MITVTKEHFSPGQILSSGQCFRMEEVKEGVWELVAGDRYLKIEETEEANAFRFHCGVSGAPILTWRKITGRTRRG